MKILQDEIDRANSVNLPSFLITNGFDLKKVGSHEYVWKDHDSLHIKDNAPGERGQWYRFSTQQGGDNIGFLREFMGLDFTQAVEMLSGEHYDRNINENYAPKKEKHITSSEKSKQTQELQLDENLDSKRVIAYLCQSRGLDYNLVTSLIKEGKIAQENHNSKGRITGNAVFKCLDENGRLVGMEKVGTSTEHRFKGIAEGSSENHGFEVKRGNGKDLFFFESSIDMLSYLQMHDKELTNCRLISMMGVKPTVVLSAMERYNVSSENVYLCSDNDKAGNEFAKRLQDEYPQMKRIVTPDDFKDWNDMLRGIKKEPNIKKENEKMRFYGNQIWNYSTDNRDKSIITLDSRDFEKNFGLLENSGLNFYAYTKDNAVKLAVNDSDLNLFKSIFGDDIKAEKSSVDYSPKSPIIGNKNYYDIDNRQFLKTNKDTALKTAELLTRSGVEFSGRIYSNGKATLTVSKKDLELANDLIHEVYSMRKHFSERTEIDAFRKNTNEKFNRIDGLSASDLEYLVKANIQHVLTDNEIQANVGEVVLCGSRSRGIERKTSDIDFAVEIESGLKEYALFNILNESKLYFGGNEVDVNPIKADESGTLGNYLKNAETYLQEKAEHFVDEQEEVITADISISEENVVNDKVEAAELTEEEKLFMQADVCKLLARDSLSSDEWEDLASPMFERGYLERRIPNSKGIFGNGLKEETLFDIAKRFQSGEDVRKELALGLMPHKGYSNIRFAFKDDDLTNRTYLYDKNLCHNLHVEYGEDNVNVLFESVQRKISYEEIGQKYIELIHEEFDDLMYWAVLDYIKDDIPDISDDTVKNLISAFDGAALHGWERNDSQTKINRIKKALFDILGDKEQTEKAFACIAKHKYNVTFEPEKEPDRLEFQFGYVDEDSEWFTESALLDDFVSENPNMSFALANSIMEYLDEKQHSERDIKELNAGWYKKTNFEITAKVNGQDFHFANRFDIGDGKGTGGGSLIDHIKTICDSIVKSDEYPYKTPESKEKANTMLEKFVPFLEKHAALSAEEQKIIDEFKSQNPIRTFDDVVKESEINEPTEKSDKDRQTNDEGRDTDRQVSQSVETSDENKQVEKNIHQVITDAGFNGGIDEPAHKGSVILHKVGDFYEMYGEDAKVGAEILGINLSAKNGEPMAGFPVHTKSEYAKKLEDAGFNVLVEGSFDKAIRLINEYCEKEFDTVANFSNMDHVDLAYTTDEETQTPIEVYADLETYRLVKEYGGIVVNEELFNSVEDMNTALEYLDFDDLVSLSDEEKAIREHRAEITENREENGLPFNVGDKVPYRAGMFVENTDMSVWTVESIEEETNHITLTRETGNIVVPVESEVTYLDDYIEYFNAQNTEIDKDEKTAVEFEITKDMYDTENPYVLEIKGKGKLADIDISVSEELWERLENSGLKRQENSVDRVIFSTDGESWNRFVIPDKWGNKTNNIEISKVLTEKEIKTASEIANKIVFDEKEVSKEQPKEVEVSSDDLLFADPNVIEKIQNSEKDGDSEFWEQDVVKGEQLSLFDDEPSVSQKSPEEKSEFAKGPIVDGVQVYNALADEIDHGSVFENSKLRVQDFFEINNPTTEQLADFLKKEYGIGGNSGDGKISFVDYDSKGLTFSFKNGEKFRHSWYDVATMVKARLDDDTYLTPEEKDRRKALAEEKGESLPDRKSSVSIGDKFRNRLTGDISEVVSLTGAMPFYTEDCTVTRKSGGFEITENVAYSQILNADMYEFIGNDSKEEVLEKPQETETPIPEKGKTAVNVGDLFRDKHDSIFEVTSLTGKAPYENKCTIHQVDDTFGIVGYASQEDLLDTESYEYLGNKENQREQINQAENFSITDNTLGEGSTKEKFANNIAAIQTLRTLEQENRPATDEEKEILSKYVGWGGLAKAFDSSEKSWESEYMQLKDLLTDSEYASARASTLDAFYTPPVVVESIYKALENFGFKGGNVLEPSLGVGNFLGKMPSDMAEKSKVYGTEIDSISGRIAQKIYPNADIKVQGFEKNNYQKNSFDVAVGNVPFGDLPFTDKEHGTSQLHDYFFLETLDKVKQGGIVAFVTSTGTLDKKDNLTRIKMSYQADLVGAIRLPSGTFSRNAGTDVTTDIIFLQKRLDTSDRPDWVDRGEINGLAINKYFEQNPDMILGDLVFDSNPFSSGTKVVAGKDLDLKSALETAVGKLSATISDEKTVDVYKTLEMSNEEDFENLRNFSFYKDNADNICFKKGDYASEIRFTPDDSKYKRVSAFIDLRDTTRELLTAQEYNKPDEEIKALQDKLNTLYDDFYKNYGLLHSVYNKSTCNMRDDVSYNLVAGLEAEYDKDKLVRKSDIFTQRTIAPPKPVEFVETAMEALTLSVFEKARIDFDYMSGLTGMSEDELKRDLSGEIFKVPHTENEYQTASEYLSGDIRIKLKEAEEIAEYDPSFNENVAALKKAMPEPLKAGDIDVKLGAVWLDPKYYEQFIYELLDTPNDKRADKESVFNRRTPKISIEYSEHTRSWHINNKGTDYSVKATSTFGSSSLNAYEIFERLLNLKEPKVYKKIEVPDPKNPGEMIEKSVVDVDKTRVVQQRAAKIKREFKAWIFKDPERRADIVERYNELFNSVRPREYDGSGLTFPMMNKDITLHEHQKNAVAHAMFGGNTLFAHCVGAGKTFEMIGAAMESKRLGLCHKSLFAVPNHLTEQIGDDFQRLYPSANILVATKRDFEKSHRQELFSKIATGNYDAVIIGHSQLGMIPISKERQRAMLTDQINDIMQGIAELKSQEGSKFQVKAMERTRKSLQKQLEKLEKNHDDTITFEQLGVDKLFVDEAHECTTRS